MSRKVQALGQGLREIFEKPRLPEFEFNKNLGDLTRLSISAEIWRKF